MGPLLLAGAQGAISLATQGIGNQMSVDKSKELARYAYNQELAQWNRENEYNLPQNQMFRLKAAGLNPNLVYGNGNAVTLASPSPKFNIPSVDMRMQAPDVVGQYQDIKSKSQLIGLQQAQIDQMEKQKELLNAQTIKTLAEGKTEEYRPENLIASTNKLNVESDIATKMAPINYDLAKTMLKKNQQEIKNLIATENISIQELKNLKQTFDYLTQHYPQLLNEQNAKNIGIFQDNINKAMDEKIKQGITKQQDIDFVNSQNDNFIPTASSILMLLNIFK